MIKQSLLCYNILMKLYTFPHDMLFLKRILKNNIDIEPLAYDISKLKIGYSIYDFIHALCDNVKNTDKMFYTCVIACGRRVLHPILAHKTLKQYTLDEIVNLISNRRVRVYHIIKYKNLKIKFGYIKLHALSNIQKDELKMIFSNHDIQSLIEPTCWKFIDSIGGRLIPSSLMQI